MTWTLEVLELAPKPGTIHWAEMNRKKKKWTTQLHYLALEAGCPQVRERQRRKVRVERHHAGVEMDKDNLSACLKVPLDALQRCNLIWTDSPKYIDLDPVDVPGQPRGKTVITLEDA